MVVMKLWTCPIQRCVYVTLVRTRTQQIRNAPTCWQSSCFRHHLGSPNGVGGAHQSHPGISSDPGCTCTASGFSRPAWHLGYKVSVSRGALIPPPPPTPTAAGVEVSSEREKSVASSAAHEYSGCNLLQLIPSSNRGKLLCFLPPSSFSLSQQIWAPPDERWLPSCKRRAGEWREPGRWLKRDMKVGGDEGTGYVCILNTYMLIFNLCAHLRLGFEGFLNFILFYFIFCSVGLHKKLNRSFFYFT